jgi:hypothetical protein
VFLVVEKSPSLLLGAHHTHPKVHGIVCPPPPPPNLLVLLACTPVDLLEHRCFFHNISICKVFEKSFFLYGAESKDSKIAKRAKNPKLNVYKII